MPNRHANNLNYNAIPSKHLYSLASNTQQGITRKDLSILITEINGRIVWTNQYAQDSLTIGRTLQETLTQSTSISQDLTKHPGPVTDLPQQLSGQNIYLNHQASKDVIQLTIEPIFLPEEDLPRWFLCYLLELTTSTFSRTNSNAPHKPLNTFKEAMSKLLHELNNPLDATQRYLSLAQMVLEQERPDKALKYLHKGQQGLQRIAMIAQNMLAANQKRSHQTHHHQSLRSLLTEVVDTIQHSSEAKSQVTLSCDIQSDFPCIDTTHLFQVFCNVTKNAIDAMPTGGTLAIQARIKQNKCMIFSFCDTGPGISPDHIPFIFDPFFSTRPQGTGLGLTICRDLLKTIKGHIYTKPVPQGACFCIEVPFNEIT